MYELLFETSDLMHKLQGFYSDWKQLKYTVRPYQVEIDRDNQRVLLQGDVITWAVQKKKGSRST